MIYFDTQLPEGPHLDTPTPQLHDSIWFGNKMIAYGLPALVTSIL
jgi:hypothetical protein